jgi:hypothetical protein
VKAKLRIRQSVYHGMDGYLVHGTDTHERRVSVFTESRSSATWIAEKIRDGRELISTDFEPQSWLTRGDCA